MAQTIVFKEICPQCAGDGVFGVTPGSPGGQPCNWKDCAQTGYITVGKYDLDPGIDDLYDRQQDILNKLDDVLEAVSGA